MFGRWLNNLKWALVLAIFAGPAVAYFSYTEANDIRRVMAEGVRAEAFIDGGEVRSGRRRGTSYTLHGIWAVDGAERSASFPISTALAEQIIVDDTLMIDTLAIQYLPNDAEAPIVVVDDAANQLENQQFLMWLGIGAGILGLIVSPIWFMIERRNKKKQDEDVDATLAQMRGGAPQQD
jgi:hypothetical protein